MISLFLTAALIAVGILEDCNLNILIKQNNKPKQTAKMPLKTLLQQLFAVENLDSRVIPTQPSQSAGTPSNKSKPKRKTKFTKAKLNKTKPRWYTWEFKLYYLAFVVVIPYMIYTAMSASNEWNELNYPKFERLLSKGWLFGRKVDNSDQQYRFFRDNFMLLVGLMGGHVMLKQFVLKLAPALTRLQFDFAFGLVFLFAAHGFNSLRILFHALIMFTVTHLFKNQRKVATTLVWSYGIGSLFINDNFRNYPMGNILPFLAPLDSVSFKGIIARWDVFFNFTLLRILSYCLDFLERYHSTSTTTSTTSTSEELKETEINDEWLTNERSRLVAPHAMWKYNIMNFCAYLFYTPLFIAGPIITFNDYICQNEKKLPSLSKKFIINYAIRLGLTILTMEFILHFIYVVAVSKTKAWENDTPFQISMIGLFNLNIIYLKLLIPWRLFRLWAMFDGIDTPENMIRMMDNNYSALAFWRAWHRSFNKWVIRYVYIPLGGSQNRILTSLAVFSFVAIWHDIELKLLFWGWLVVLFLIPEMLATNYCAPYQNQWWFRHLCALGAVINIWLMMIANIFGFCLGADGTKALLHEMFFQWQGLSFFFTATACLFIAVQVMFEIRQEEQRRGIYLKC